MSYPDIDRLIKRSSKFAKIHQSVAQLMADGYLLCGNCGAEKKLDIHLVEMYLRNGWPECCTGALNGGTMGFYREGDRKRKA